MEVSRVTLANQIQTQAMPDSSPKVRDSLFLKKRGRASLQLAATCSIIVCRYHAERRCESTCLPVMVVKEQRSGWPCWNCTAGRAERRLRQARHLRARPHRWAGTGWLAGWLAEGKEKAREGRDWAPA